MVCWLSSFVTLLKKEITGLTLVVVTKTGKVFLVAETFVCTRGFLFAWQCTSFHGKKRHFPSWGSIMVGCNQIFEGMNHRLLGCTLQRNDPSATWSQLLHWCARSDDPEEASLGQAGHLHSHSIHFNGWWFHLSHLDFQPWQVGHPVELVTPLCIHARAWACQESSCFLWWGWSRWPIQWRCVGAQEAAAGSCFSPMQGRCPALAASDPGALLRARCAGAAVQWVSHRGSLV